MSTQVWAVQKKKNFLIYTPILEREGLWRVKNVCQWVLMPQTVTDFPTANFTQKAGFDWWVAPPSMDDSCPWGNDNFSLDTAQSKALFGISEKN